MTPRSGEAPQASGSLRMREPEELAGRWTLSTSDKTCAITFAASRMEEANGWAIDAPPPCLAALVPGAIAWRPVPEGLAFAAADRRTLVVFTVTDRDGTAVAMIGGRPATLRRGG